MSLSVIKRSGKTEEVYFDKIVKRISELAVGLKVNPHELSLKVIQQMSDHMKTSDLDKLSANIAAGMIMVHPDYSKLAAKILVSDLHKNTTKTFSQTMREQRLSPETLEVIDKFGQDLDAAIRPERDYNHDYFGLLTMIDKYLNKGETPQYMFMRVAVGIHGSDKMSVIQTYNDMSNGYYTHATPTLYNSGTTTPQMSSCFLLDIDEDSISGIFKTISDTAEISKYAGGVGLSVSKIRAKNSPIGNNPDTKAKGIVAMLQVFDSTARFVDQGGKRKGSFAIYLEPWHADIKDFLNLRLPSDVPYARTRDLSLGLWIPDLFMERVEADGMWSLMCPHACPGLTETYGDEFNKLYLQYESEGRFVEQVAAKDIWERILHSQQETGYPYMLYKDACNRKSNQQHLGTIKSSNLCTEIIEYTSREEQAVCNLASLALPKFVSGGNILEALLEKKTKQLVINLNKIIDRNHYPTPETRASNLRHRPIGIGVQGLADVFFKLDTPYDSQEARLINKRIFRIIYKAAVEQSMELAKVYGPHESFEGSPASKGMLQPQLWGSDDLLGLAKQVAKHGLRNSLLTAPMPTASTSQILGNTESFEPKTQQCYKRNTLAGSFVIINPYLVDRLTWTPELAKALVVNDGSVQHLDIPEHTKNVFRTVWEISQKSILEMAADRALYIDQSQSMSAHFATPTKNRLHSFHMTGWRLGLKTGMYYLRQKAGGNAIKFTEEGCAVCSG